MTRLLNSVTVGLLASTALVACVPMSDLGSYDERPDFPRTVEGVARALKLEGVPFAPIPIGKYAKSQLAQMFVADGLIYAISESNAVHAIQLADGTPRWTVELDRRPDADDGFVPGADRVGFLTNNHLTVVKRDSGARVLDFGLSFSPSSPGVLTGDSFYSGSWGNGYSLRSASLADGWAGWSMPAGEAIRGKPLIVGTSGADAMLVYASSDGRVVSVEPRPATGSSPTPFWVAQTHGSSVSGLATDGALIFVASSEGAVYAFSKGAGEVRWKWFGAHEPLHATPVAAHGNVYQSLSGGIAVLDGATGNEKYRVEGAKSYLAHIGDRDFYAAADRTVIAVDTATGEVTAKVHSPLFEQLAADAGGSLLFSDGMTIYCVR